MFTPLDLLRRLGDLAFSGRLSLVSAGTPRRVVTLHLERGKPALVIGTGIPRDLLPDDEGYQSRQVLLDALGWAEGRFSITASEPGNVRANHGEQLGNVPGLTLASEHRIRTWRQCAQKLPGPWDQVTVMVGTPGDQPREDMVESVIFAHVASGPAKLQDLARKTQIDEHVVLETVTRLIDAGDLRLDLPEEMPVGDTGALEKAVTELLDLVQNDGSDENRLKITVLSWSSATSFRAVDALFGRTRTPPEEIETMARYQVISEELRLNDGTEIDVLAFRSDAFEPDFCAPLVQGCHLFLLFSDLETGHLWSEDGPLVERINALRKMYTGASVAGRITVGASAETDPGCDVLLPELGRYLNWEEIQDGSFLLKLLTEVSRRLS
ncbi:MAG: hypothetical protein DRJ65_21565 [Acidobacteria bacterium]|nr:MAG: hypothetical protein DRJ65_21565 [Acidobacteriota bacterium]